MRPTSVSYFKSAQRYLRGLMKLAGVDGSQIPVSRQMLEYAFSLKLSMARPRLLWDEQGATWMTGWDIGSLESAMYLMFFFDIRGRGHILMCPWCQNIFLGDHPRTQFCSPRCQNSDKVHRYRQRLAEPKRKGKKIKHTTSKKGSSHGASKRKR